MQIDTCRRDDNAHYSSIGDILELSKWVIAEKNVLMDECDKTGDQRKRKGQTWRVGLPTTSIPTLAALTDARARFRKSWLLPFKTAKFEVSSLINITQKDQ